MVDSESIPPEANKHLKIALEHLEHARILMHDWRVEPDGKIVLVRHREKSNG